VIAQFLGGYVAALLVYAQWHNFLVPLEEALIAGGKYDELNFTPQGVAGIFALYAPTGANLGWIFLNEFVNVRRRSMLLNRIMTNEGTVSFRTSSLE